MLYQLEVKRYLVEHHFPPSQGWEVTVDVDPMELAKGGSHPQDKRERASLAKEWLVDAGVAIRPHPEFGRTDIVACGPNDSTFLVEVEGESTKQKEQAVYSALGQVILLMRPDTGIRYGLAVPDTQSWGKQISKIPAHIRSLLSLTLWQVSDTAVREIK